MRKIEDIIYSIGISVDKSTIMTYVELKWVRPIYKEDAYYFEDIDIARIRLIHHLKHHLLIEDTAMDIILSLLDQLYGTRNQLNLLCAAIKAQPQSAQKGLMAAIAIAIKPVQKRDKAYDQ